MLVLTILIFAALAAIETAVLIKKKYIRDIFVLLVLMAIALIYSISGVTDWNFPGPPTFDEMLFKPISQLVFPSRAQ